MVKRWLPQRDMLSLLTTASLLWTCWRLWPRKSVSLRACGWMPLCMSRLRRAGPIKSAAHGAKAYASRRCRQYWRIPGLTLPPFHGQQFMQPRATLQHGLGCSTRPRSEVVGDCSRKAILSTFFRHPPLETARTVDKFISMKRKANL